MKSWFIPIALYLLGFSTLSAQYPPKNFMIEDHTGAWCGWCVLGNQALEDYHAEFGARIIPIAVHNGDGMALPIQKSLAGVHGISGYPSGVINRRMSNVGGNSSYGIHPSDWPKVLDSNSMTQTSPVKIDIEQWIIDTNAKTVTIKVKAEFFDDINRALRFNCAVMEDYVKGKGKPFDQVNYLSNRSGYEAHPYFYQPETITDFEHMNVVRGYGAGVEGIAGALPNDGVFAQDIIRHTFTIPFDSLRISNVNNCWVAAWVQESTEGYEILNAASAGKQPTPKSIYVASTISVLTPPAQVEPGATHNHTIKVTNPREFPISVNVSVENDASIIADGWSFSINPSIVEIPAKSFKTVTLETKAGTGIGAANYSLKAQVVPKDNIRGLSTKAQTNVISKQQDIVLMHFKDTPVEATLSNYLDLISSPLYAGKVSIIAVSDSNINSFNFSSARAFIVGESYPSRTTLIYGSKKILPFIDAQYKAGKPFLMWSPMNLWLVAGNYPPDVTPQIKDIWNETFGIDGEVYPWQPMLYDVTNREAIEFGVKGLTNDPIVNGISLKVNESGNPMTSIWVDCIRILDYDKASPMVFYDNAALQDPLNIAAVKIRGANRVPAIYQGFPMEVAGMKNAEGIAMRRVLFQNYMDYLLNMTDIGEAPLNPLNISLGPNPVQNILNVCMSQSAPATWHIYAEKGNEVASGNTIGDSFVVNCEQFSAGAYHAIIEQGTLKSLVKFIVNH